MGRGEPAPVGRGQGEGAAIRHDLTAAAVGFLPHWSGGHLICDPLLAGEGFPRVARIYLSRVSLYPDASRSLSKAFRMRPEIQTQLDNAKQSIGLLRRHL